MSLESKKEAWQCWQKHSATMQELVSQGRQPQTCSGTVKLEMFADINVCEFVILKVFALLKFAILVLPKVNFVFPQAVFYYCFF